MCGMNATAHTQLVPTFDQTMCKATRGGNHRLQPWQQVSCQKNIANSQTAGNSQRQARCGPPTLDHNSTGCRLVPNILPTTLPVLLLLLLLLLPAASLQDRVAKGATISAATRAHHQPPANHTRPQQQQQHNL
jgi:hypothetical protein